MPDTLDILRTTGALLYGLWPIFLLTAVGRRRLPSVFAAWTIVLMGGLLAATSPESRSMIRSLSSLWLPQPWNLGVFLLVGLGLGARMYKRYRSPRWY